MLYDSRSPYTFAQQFPNATIKSLVEVWRKLPQGYRRCKLRSWYESRESHRYKAYKESRSAYYALTHRPPGSRTIKGCVKFAAGTSPDQVKETIRRFQRLRSDFCKATGVTIAILCKAHIIIRHQVDSLHYDFIGFHNLPYNDQTVRRKILSLWKQAGGAYGACVPVDDVDKIEIKKYHDTSLVNLTDYAMKYAKAKTATFDRFMDHFALPRRKLIPVCWRSGPFYPDLPITIEYRFNGQHRTKEVTNKRDQSWYHYIKEQFSSADPVELETTSYKHEVQLQHAVDQVTTPIIYSQYLYGHTHHDNRHKLCPTKDLCQFNPQKELTSLFPRMTHDTNRYGEYWLQPIHNTGHYKIAVDEQNMPGPWIQSRYGHDSFTADTLTRVLSKLGWRVPKEFKVTTG